MIYIKSLFLYLPIERAIFFSVNYSFVHVLFLTGKPNPPNNVTCFARPNSVLIHWKSSFNGGDTQIFLINIQKNGELHFYDYDQAYVDPGQNKYSKATIEQLAQGTMYKFRVKALNKHNFTLSETVSCNTTLTGKP